MSSASKLLPKSGTALQCYDGIRTGSTIQFHLVVELDRIPWFPPLAFVWVTLMPWAPWLSNRMPRLAEQHPTSVRITRSSNLEAPSHMYRPTFDSDVVTPRQASKP
ncbi:hypothetical protein PPTG_22596 [Phytophthora nicotianae INRA-310]|uniref:Uncharacterized protein n=1 Tax=Phytophthora nicotianae (strain INRA-310) TaxID=761204 RepID=W2QEI3_PHYN3|nr:hypothetical protein PPTG_22596 [Phytophthora nicotianae INRA-310]ETN11577.1 hypothetical protein PPTG_22596 [Phytophthora nicotianae INRA-310]